MLKNFLYIIAFLLFQYGGISAQSIKGKVYLDQNHNLKFDVGEIAIKDVLVSNGRDVVQTNAKGEWHLPKNNKASVFLIQPSGYLVPPNESMIPQHYQLIDDATDEVSFPLWKDDVANNEFEALFYGDTQARGKREVNFVMHDVVEECIGAQARFGVALGDIVADDPELFDEISAGIGQIGVPWYYVFGNHDHDKGVTGNEGADATFVKNFGPSNYAYEFGKVAFIALNDIYYKEEGGYKAHFTEDQLLFVEQYLSFVPEDYLVVLMMHIPIVACDNRQDMFHILEKRKHTLSIAGHTHELANVFVDIEYGWNADQPHHMFINGTVSGSWWCGIKDELGIPHATMNDGAPNGYAIIEFSGNEYEIRYKAARRPADYQMNIYLPDELSLNSLDTTKVLVNVFNGSSKSTVQLQLDQTNDWIDLSQTVARDPANIELYRLSSYLDHEVNRMPLDEELGWKMDYPSESGHFWTGELPENLKVGTHKLTIRTIDMFGNVFFSYRIFRIVK